MPEEVEPGGAESVVQAVDATLLREAVEGLPDKLREAVITVIGGLVIVFH